MNSSKFQLILEGLLLVLSSCSKLDANNPTPTVTIIIETKLVVESILVKETVQVPATVTPTVKPINSTTPSLTPTITPTSTITPTPTNSPTPTRTLISGHQFNSREIFYIYSSVDQSYYCWKGACNE